MQGEPRAFLQSLYRAAVAAAHPATVYPPHFPPPPRGRVIVLAAGKGGGAAAEVAERHYREVYGLGRDRLGGLAVTRHGHGRPTELVPVVEAGHPVPDTAGLAAAAKTLEIADGAGRDDLVLVLLSGGASANWVAPAPGINLGVKQRVTRGLLRSGAPIGVINTVRKHLSRIKGGRLAARAAPARVLTLAISDVPGDDPSVIGSGPTVPDPTTLADARRALAEYGVDVPPDVAAVLADAANETPKPGDPLFDRAEFRIVSRPAEALAAAHRLAESAGYDVVDLGADLEGEAREVAQAHADLARHLARSGRRAVVLSGGELTVTMRGQGRGGPNQEYALALAGRLNGAPGIWALAADTDGADGGGGRADDPAGAVIDPTTCARAGRKSLDLARFLNDNDSTRFFDALGDTLRTGPTLTNVNDLRAILVDGAAAISPSKAR